jgi:hypothetical protein
MYSKQEELPKKNKKKTDSQTKKTYTYKEEKEKKNGIKDSILFAKKKHMKGRSIQYPCERRGEKE